MQSFLAVLQKDWRVFVVSVVLFLLLLLLLMLMLFPYIFFCGTIADDDDENDKSNFAWKVMLMTKVLYQLAAATASREIRSCCWLDTRRFTAKSSGLPRMTVKTCECLTVSVFLHSLIWRAEDDWWSVRWRWRWWAALQCLSSHRFTLISPARRSLCGRHSQSEERNKLSRATRVKLPHWLTVWTFFRVTHLRRHTRCTSPYRRSALDWSSSSSSRSSKCTRAPSVAKKEGERGIWFSTLVRHWCGTWSAHHSSVWGQFWGALPPKDGRLAQSANGSDGVFCCVLNCSSNSTFSSVHWQESTDSEWGGERKAKLAKPVFEETETETEAELSTPPPPAKEHRTTAAAEVLHSTTLATVCLTPPSKLADARSRTSPNCCLALSVCVFELKTDFHRSWRQRLLLQQPLSFVEQCSEDCFFTHSLMLLPPGKHWRRRRSGKRRRAIGNCSCSILQPVTSWLLCLPSLTYSLTRTHLS